MRIGIDANEANLVQRVGVGQYAVNLLRELSKLKTSHQFHLYLKNPPLPDMPPESTNWHYHVFGPSKFWTRFALPLHLYFGRPKLDFFYSPGHYSPQFCPCPTIPTIHDLGYLSSKDGFTPKDFYQLTKWTEQSLRRARHIIAVSEFTKSEITRIYGINPQKISVVYNGVGKPPSKNLSFIDSPYYVAVGTLKPNKNLPFLITAFAQFLRSAGSPPPKLVIAGKKGWLFSEIFQTVKKEGIESSVIFTDYITEDQKWSLYKNAIATVIPSTYEGFGIPAIESQKVGTPVISSNIPALKEVLGQSAIFINPQKINTLVKALQEVQNPKLRRLLIKFGLNQSAQFTWTNSAKTLLNIFNTI